MKNKKSNPKGAGSKDKINFNWEQKKKEDIDQVKQAIKTATDSKKKKISEEESPKEETEKPKKGSLDLGGKPGAQDLGEQVEEVREEKQEKEEKKDEDEAILVQLKKQREQEEQEARADANEILPGSDHPQRGSALKKKKKKGGTEESSKLKN